MLLVFVYVFLAAIEVPLLLQFVVPQPWESKGLSKGPKPVLLSQGWPTSTPHQQPWPAPTQLSKTEAFMRRRQSAWSVSSLNGMLQTTHHMHHDTYGWPLPSLYRTQRWWPASPTWASDAPWDTGIRVSWTGFFFNPLLVVLSIGLVWLGPIGIKRAIIDRRRRKLGRCSSCGYPVGVSPVCTECGAAITPSPTVTNT